MENSNAATSSWVSFQKEANNKSNHPSEPIDCELNDIPLNLDNLPNEHSITKAGIDSTVINPLPPPLQSTQKNEQNDPMPRKNSAAHYQQKSSSINYKYQQNKEIILQVSQNSAGSEQNSNDKQYKNGQLLTTVFPSNSHCAWLIPPHYDCKMPTILTNKQNLLANSTYASILNSIVSDLRFFSYSVLYSRITPSWLIFSIIILLAVLASSPSGGFPIMIFALVWLIMLVLGLILCILIRKYIVLSLRNLFKDVNKIAFKNKILVGVQDKGQLSCHKVALMFIYYDPTGCKEDTLKLLRVEQGNFTTTSSDQKQLSDEELAQKAEDLVCQYSQEYAKAYMKRRFLFPSRPSEGVSEFRPKHCERNLCICQYIEREYFGKSDAKKTAPWYERVFAV